jgi:addiction module HigA family antidote
MTTQTLEAEAVALPALLPNTHPGQMLREDFLEPLGISPYRLAKGTGLSPIHVSEILSGKRNVTPMTSLLLGKFLGMSPRFWLALQNRYDLIETERAHRDKLAKVVPYITAVQGESS